LHEGKNIVRDPEIVLDYRNCFSTKTNHVLSKKKKKTITDHVVCVTFL